MASPATHAATDFAYAELPGDQFHQLMHRQRQLHPVSRVRFGGRPAFLIAGHAELAAAFKDNDLFPPADAYRVTIEPVQGVTFQTMEAENHRLYRRLATPAFRSRAVAQMEVAGLTQIANELIAKLPPAECDFTRAFSHRYPFLVISRMLGIPGEREEEFRGWAAGFLAFNTQPEHAKRCARHLTDYLRPIIRARRQHPRDDVISGLVQADVGGQRLTDEEVLSNIRLLFTAGASTTTDALGNLLYALLRERSLWELLLENPALRAPAIEELLRWETPVAILPRVSARYDLEFAGVAIPARSFCLFAIAAANRDPLVFADADSFMLDRNCAGTMLSFGPGPRLCPGLHLARKQLAVVLDVLMEQLPGLELSDVAAASPVGTILRGPGRLPVCY